MPKQLREDPRYRDLLIRVGPVRVDHWPVAERKRQRLRKLAKFKCRM